MLAASAVVGACVCAGHVDALFGEARDNLRVRACIGLGANV